MMSAQDANDFVNTMFCDESFREKIEEKLDLFQFDGEKENDVLGDYVTEAIS